MNFTDLLKLLLEKQSLTREQVRYVFKLLMEGQLTPVQTAAFLTALRMKVETVEEITGAAEAMRSAALPVHYESAAIVDTCGTGGDGKGSFNISTAAAFVVAGAGYLVAKHGNRSISSHCGSADVLEALKIPIENDAATVERCLKEVGIAFLFAPSFHPAMRHAMPIRKELGIRTIFNLLGPLTNPIHPNVQLLGVYESEWVQPVAKVLVQLGIRQGFVVHGQGHDEIVLSGPTQVAEIREGRVHMRAWNPKDFGLTRQEDPQVAGSTPAQHAKVLMKLLQGEKGPLRDVVCMNAAAAILAAARQTSGASMGLEIKDAFAIAQNSIDEHKALEKLTSLRDTLNKKVPHD